MGNVAQVFRDEPHRFFARHPVKMVKAREIHGPGIRAQGAASAQIEIIVEVAHGQFSQGAIDRLTVTASGVVRLRDCTPAISDHEDGDHMIGVTMCFHVEEQSRKPEHAQGRRSKNSSFKAMAGELTQHPARRPARIGEVVRHLVEQALDTYGSAESAQGAQFRRGEGLWLRLAGRRFQLFI